MTKPMKVARLAAGLLAGAGALTLAQAASAADWLVRAQALGVAKSDAGYSLCGSSDGSLECSEIDHGQGKITHAPGGAKITIQATAQSLQQPQASVGSNITADLASATIRQSNTAAFADGKTYGRLNDQLLFSLADPTAVYEIPFSYSYDGTLTGASSPDGSYHPSLFSQSDLTLGSSEIDSTQGFELSGAAYNAPAISLTNGSGEWTNVVVTPGQFGYTVSGDLLVGGDWGRNIGFQMISTIDCGDDVGEATCDFSHTQKFAFGALPDGVSFTSASGVFLTAPTETGGVPEPSAWALMIGGLGLTGSALRAARRIRGEAIQPAA